MEDVYAQRQLQVGWRAAESRVRLQYAQASHHRYATRRRNSRRKTLGHSVERDKGPTKFKVGDSVHMSKYKTIFEKGYTSNWITEVFTIVKVTQAYQSRNLFTRRLSRKIRAFYERLHPRYLSHVYLVEKILGGRKKDKEYVKWLGYDGLQFMDANGKTMLFDKILIYIFYFYI